MNIVLFEPGEWSHPLAAQDSRALHLIEILRLSPGDRFAAGEVGGPIGTLEFSGWQGTDLVLRHPEWSPQPPPGPLRVGLIIGTPRPPTARRLLKDLTTLGASALLFTATDLGDKSYLQSTLWTGEFRKNLLEGAAQTRTTLLPAIEQYPSLKRALSAVDARTVEGGVPGTRVWFDEGGPSWLSHGAHTQAVQGGTLWLALGPERGWSPAERLLFETQGWQTAGLGTRVLRTETACALALGVAGLTGWGPEDATPRQG